MNRLKKKMQFRRLVFTIGLVCVALVVGVAGMIGLLQLHKAQTSGFGACAALPLLGVVSGAAMTDDEFRQKVLGGVDKLIAPCRCWLTPLQTMIDAKGDVFLCCYYLHRRARHRIGNINKQTFREIWEGPRHKRAINAIRPSECNLFDCRFINYMKIIEPLLNDSLHQTDFI